MATKMGNIFLLNVFFICLLATVAAAATDKIFCYHGSWSTYRWGNGKFMVEDIDPRLCTHLLYTFVGINEDGTVKILDPYLEVDSGNLKRFNALKLKNTKLKTLLSVGGWNEGSLKYSRTAADPQKRANLIQSAFSLVQTYGFDGFDLDWEYPAQRGGSSADKSTFATLLQEFHQKFKKHGLLLTAAVAASSFSVDISYDVSALSQYLDFINVMTYDFHGSYDGMTGQNAPLFASSSADNSPLKRELNVAAAVAGWLRRGADPEKLVMGLAVYGRTFTLANAARNGVGAPIVSAGSAGKYTQESGFLGYNEICELQLEDGWTTVWDAEQETPYAFKGNQWVGYDNARSIAAKVDFAKSQKLAGVMIWSIETDDFNGVCGPKYPILTAINAALNRTTDDQTQFDYDNDDKLIPTTFANEVTNKPAVSPNVPTNPSKICVKSGYVRDPSDCAVFYYCLSYNNQFIALRQMCNLGLYYDDEKQMCNYRELVKC